MENLKLIDYTKKRLDDMYLMLYTIKNEVNMKKGEIIENVDVYDYICWKDGLMRFKSENLSNILKRLSDYYGKDICWGKEIEDLKCSGKLDLKEDMENVLDGLTKMLPVVYSKNGENYHFSMNN